mmetsp:Transcript_5870/g.13900  ORF Transcript_5870/g.13900 Transcript_5870/m.13900 type:complete len:248 (+) Transcript_5870:423-1166(+)
MVHPQHRELFHVIEVLGLQLHVLSLTAQVHSGAHEERGPAQVVLDKVVARWKPARASASSHPESCHRHVLRLEVASGETLPGRHVAALLRYLGALPDAAVRPELGHHHHLLVDVLHDEPVTHRRLAELQEIDWISALAPPLQRRGQPKSRVVQPSKESYERTPVCNEVLVPTPTRRTLHSVDEVAKLINTRYVAFCLPRPALHTFLLLQALSHSRPFVLLEHRRCCCSILGDHARASLREAVSVELR